MAFVNCPNCSNPVSVLYFDTFTSCSRCRALVRVTRTITLHVQDAVLVEAYGREPDLVLHSSINAVDTRSLMASYQLLRNQTLVQGPIVMPSQGSRGAARPIGRIDAAPEDKEMTPGHSNSSPNASAGGGLTGLVTFLLLALVVVLVVAFLFPQ